MSSSAEAEKADQLNPDPIADQRRRPTNSPNALTKEVLEEMSKMGTFKIPPENENDFDHLKPRKYPLTKSSPWNSHERAPKTAGRQFKPTLKPSSRTTGSLAESAEISRKKLEPIFKPANFPLKKMIDATKKRGPPPAGLQRIDPLGGGRRPALAGMHEI